MKILLFIAILFSMGFAQENITSLKDTLIYRNGDRIIGDVKLIKEQTIEFTKSEDDLTYEIKKTSIARILLKNGRIIEFIVDESNQLSEKESDEKARDSGDSDSGANTCLIVGGTAGFVILILAVIGAVVQSRNK